MTVDRSSVLRAAGWSLTWAVGVALGVALGAYLTVLGAAAAPGDVALDATELLILPAIAGGVVFVVSFVARVIIAFVRRIPSAREGDGYDGDRNHSEGNGITGVQREVPSADHQRPE